MKIPPDVSADLVNDLFEVAASDIGDMMLDAIRALAEADTPGEAWGKLTNLIIESAAERDWLASRTAAAVLLHAGSFTQHMKEKGRI